MKATRMIPASLGEINAAYILGRDLSGNGYAVIWSGNNGLMIHAVLERLYDDGHWVVVTRFNR
jgi:hypothetical protein